MSNVLAFPATTTRPVAPSRFDRAVQLGAISILTMAGTAASLVAFGGYCAEGSAICDARTVQLEDLGQMFNPGATLDAGQVIDRRGER